MPDDMFNDHVTTDGAGVCTLSYMKRVAIEFNNEAGRAVLTSTPTGLQIRLLHYKGCIFGYSDDHPVIIKLRNKYGQTKHLFLRDSMKKFKAHSSYEYMDVLNVSKSMPYSYSKATFPILEALGVPNEVCFIFTFCS
jgi:hypothetical protein